ncbi:hypothetical protein BO70DRAFT_222699 [Aspergillus heteromorphus CBS 117.55]|uniref:Uncharacterized protein n=1 Tax=Aspergillus heteromorphus CBS 117.55 TaxID=1448321 RepID=A0A317WME7_9EURO|nr:uncharacterized protein BO70DRAFT_222699 [Aspergillus heteromorphus CBS 117.55]PWY86198.1 hypothetical protein BO70DRAFT_222699 [Aspergillus heteromorphus CBS 117.55]
MLMKDQQVVKKEKEKKERKKERKRTGGSRNPSLRQPKEAMAIAMKCANPKTHNNNRSIDRSINRPARKKKQTRPMTPSFVSPKKQI